MTINVIAGSGLSSNTAALAAFDAAAAEWTSVWRQHLHRQHGPTTTPPTRFAVRTSAGQTLEVFLSASYSTLRNALAASGTGVGDALDTYLPTAAQFNVALSLGFCFSGQLAATKANLNAIGFTGLDQQFGTSDATITFNSEFDFPL
jgi:hypothetical protein